MSTTTAQTEFMEYLRSKSIAVISTVSPNGQPMSATIYFAVDENFNFYFSTKHFTRKHTNLEHNHEVALVIGTGNEPATAQIQGTAEKITDPKEFELKMALMEKVLFKNDYVAPLFQMQSDKNEIELYKITPTWIRWFDFRGEKADGGFIQILP